MPGKMRKKQAHHCYQVPGSSLGMEIDDLTTATAQIRRGLNYRKFTQFQRASLLPAELIAKIIKLPKRTLARRKESGKLSQAESERLVRLAVVYEKATNLFEGNQAEARSWLSRPSKALGDVPPLLLAETELGARAVEDLIGQLEHGVFA
jgi:putative toxin-antitoxin system antitoxin component (TIGR02293 family)